MCVCVCVRERERERETDTHLVSFVDLSSNHTHADDCVRLVMIYYYCEKKPHSSSSSLTPSFPPSTLSTTNNFSHDSYFFLRSNLFSPSSLPAFSWVVKCDAYNVQHMQSCISEYKLRKGHMSLGFFAITPGFVSPPCSLDNGFLFL